MFASSPNPFPHFSFHHVKKPHPTSPKSTVSVHATAQTKNPTYLSTEMASSASLYEVLGVPKSASGHEIKAAYRRLARVCHPDVVSMNQKETSAGEFMKIHAAYSTLSDPDKRANYDRDLCGSGPFYSSSSLSGFSGYSRRNWETDQCW